MARAIAAVGAALMLTPAALAADPRDIARDLEDGRLDGTYTAQELRRFLTDATVQGYGSPEARVAGEQIVRQRAAGGGPAGAEVAPAQRGFLPFTGVDLALMTAGGLALLVLGAGMRRLARDRA